MRASFSKLFLGFLIGFIFFSCTSKDKLSPEESAKRGYDRGIELLDGHQYEMAIEKFRFVKDTYPLTHYAIKAELKIADSYFANEDYVEALSAYEVFKEIHPENPAIPYVQFRIGLSHYKMIPPTTDRDLTSAKKAIEQFGILVTRYPNSELVKEAQEKIRACEEMLAEKELYVARFYWRMDKDEPAIRRLLGLIRDFPRSQYVAESRLLLAEIYMHKKENEEARKHLQKIISDHPKREQAGEAKKILENLK